MSSLKFLTPYITEGFRTCFIMSAGDLITQAYVEKKRFQEVDLTRIAKFGSVGLVYVGPFLRFWYGILDNVVSKQQSMFRRGLKKMLADQIFVAPIFAFTIILIFSLINHETREEFEHRMRHDFLNVLKQGYMIWPAAQLINFTIIPVKYQVSFVRLVAWIWKQ